MLPREHAILGIIVAALLHPIFGTNVWMIAAAAVLIDIDHYFIYIYRFRSFDLKKAYWYFRGVKDGSGFYPLFHMIELVAAEAVFVYFYPMFLPLLIGQVLHIAQDWFEDNFLRRTNRNFFAMPEILR